MCASIHKSCVSAVRACIIDLLHLAATASQSTDSSAEEITVPVCFCPFVSFISSNYSNILIFTHPPPQLVTPLPHFYFILLKKPF